MLGLMKKDLINLRKTLEPKDILIILILVAASFVFFKEMASLLLGMILLMGGSSYCSTFAYKDDNEHWDEYESVLPLTIKEIVRSRYYVCLLLLATAAILVFFLNVFTCMFYKAYGFQFYFLVFLVEFLFAYFHLLMAIPLSYKRGVNGSSNITAIFIVIILLAFWGVRYFDISIIQIISYLNIVSIAVILLLLCIFGTYLSYYISIQIKRLKRDIYTLI